MANFFLFKYFSFQIENLYGRVFFQGLYYVIHQSLQGVVGDVAILFV